MTSCPSGFLEWVAGRRGRQRARGTGRTEGRRKEGGREEGGRGIHLVK